MPLSNSETRRILEHQAGKTLWAFKPLVVGLSSTIPDLDGNNVSEPSAGANYQAVMTVPQTWGVYVPRQLVNALPVAFPVCLVADWGTNLIPIIAAVYYHDQTDRSAESYAGFYVFPTPQIIAVGFTAKFEAGQLFLKNLYP